MQVEKCSAMHRIPVLFLHSDILWALPRAMSYLIDTNLLLGFHCLWPPSNIKETVSQEFAVDCSSCFSGSPSCQWLVLWTVPGALQTVPFWLAIILKKYLKKAKRETHTLWKHGSNLFFYCAKFCQGRQRLLWFTGVRSTTWLWFPDAAQMLGLVPHCPIWFHLLSGGGK